MAEQDEPQADKPQIPVAGMPQSAPARAESLPLSAAAAAAAAKMEATLAASRAAGARHAGSDSPVVPEVASLAEPVAEPVEHQMPHAAPVAPNPAISAAAAAASSLAATATDVPKAAAAGPTQTKPAGKKPAVLGTPAAKKPAAAVKPAAKPAVAKPAVAKPAPEPEEIEDIIAKIPVEPLVEPVKAPPTILAPAAGSVSKDEDTEVIPRPTAANPAAANAAMTASAVAEARNRVFGSYTPVPEPTPAARDRRAAREAALDAKPPLARTLQVLLAIAYPFVLMILAIRLVASSAFLWFAYQRPGFPVDGFGFSTADRLTYGSYGVDYLNNVADSRYLSELRDPLGNPLFLNTEVQHMLDVKNVISATYLGGMILGVIVLITLFYLGKRYAGGIRRGLFAGAVATLVLFAALTTTAILGWDAFFTGFHKIFFANGTWTFNYSDTLIRLYPPQFWVDAAITIGVLVIAVSVITLIATWPTGKRREASRLLQEARVFGLK